MLNKKIMFPKYFSQLSSAPSQSSLASPPPPPPLLWSCLNSNSAAAELLQLARKSKERSEHDHHQDTIKTSSSPSPPPPTVSPAVSHISAYKPLLKFSVNAILSRDASDEDQKPSVTSLRRSASPVSPAAGGQSPPSYSSHPSAHPPPPSSVSNPPSPPAPGYLAPPAPVPRPFLPHPILPPHLHPLLYQQSSIPRTGFTLPGSATTLFPLPGTFPWSSGFRGEGGNNFQDYL